MTLTAKIIRKSTNLINKFVQQKVNEFLSKFVEGNELRKHKFVGTSSLGHKFVEHKFVGIKINELILLDSESSMNLSHTSSLDELQVRWLN